MCIRDSNKARNLKLKINQLDTEINDLLATHPLTKKQERDLDALDAKKHQLEDKLKTHKFQIKSAQSSAYNDRGAGFYNFQIAVKDIASQLDGVDIILVDDNLVEGHTLRDAVCALFKMNIHPKSIMAITPHYLV